MIQGFIWKDSSPRFGLIYSDGRDVNEVMIVGNQTGGRNLFLL